MPPASGSVHASEVGSAIATTHDEPSDTLCSCTPTASAPKLAVEAWRTPASSVALVAVPKRFGTGLKLANSWVKSVLGEIVGVAWPANRFQLTSTVALATGAPL